MKKVNLAIDASRSLSGGGMSHIVGIIEEFEFTGEAINKVHLFTPLKISKRITPKSWLVVHNYKMLEGNLLMKFFWQFFILPGELKKYDCSSLLSTDAGTIRVVNPSCVMSRDMLSFEHGEIDRYNKWSFQWWRLWALRYIQINSLKKSTCAVFLTEYASQNLQSWTGQFKNKIIIPHGIGKHFKEKKHNKPWPAMGQGPVKCVYVSNAAMYKHQWKVMEAIYILRKEGYDLTISFIGGGTGPAQQLLDKSRSALDPHNQYSNQMVFVDNKDLPALLQEYDLYIFASSCENMPNTLLEGMSMGMPIACSERGPMPEILKDGGVYFDPEDELSISRAIEKIISDEKYRNEIKSKAYELASGYSWKKCSNATFELLVKIANR